MALKNKPRFLVSNFMGAITVHMNKEFALELFDLIRGTPDVAPHLYALTEKFENQFFFMGDLTQRRKPVEAEVEVAAESSDAAEAA